jgi:hypothetical protein
MKEQKGFNYLIADDSDHERVFCEIYYDNLFIALVSQERGDGLFDLETPGPGLVEEGIMRKVDVPGFLDAVEIACRRLRGEQP